VGLLDCFARVYDVRRKERKTSERQQRRRARKGGDWVVLACAQHSHPDPHSTAQTHVGAILSLFILHTNNRVERVLHSPTTLGTSSVSAK
jgi:hypothetical protein